MWEAITGFFGAFFILGGFWFWVLFIAYFSSIIALADHEQNTWAAIITTVFLLGVFQFNPLLVVNWHYVPWLLLGYGLAGIMMSYIKWITYLKVRAQKYVDLKDDFREYYNDNAGDADTKIPLVGKDTSMKEVLNDVQFKQFGRYLKDEGFLNHREKRIIPQWKDKSSKLISWALWWPAVIFWTFANDYVVGFFRWAVRATRKYYEALAARIFAIVGVSQQENDEIRY